MIEVRQPERRGKERMDGEVSTGRSRTSQLLKGEERARQRQRYPQWREILIYMYGSGVLEHHQVHSCNRFQYGPEAGCSVLSAL